MSDQTRLERIMLALLNSDYCKLPFLEAFDVAGMARKLEIALDEVAALKGAELDAYTEGRLLAQVARATRRA